MKDKAKSTLRNPVLEIEIEKNYSRYYWIIIPVLTAVYFIFSYFSSGFYQDDEVAHYINMRDFWSDPWIIMSNWGKPGWKIFLVLPSLAGYEFVLFINSIITSLTAYFTILLAKELKLKNTILAGIFFAFQPLVLQLSFRSYAEIFTGFLIVLSLYFYFKNRYILSALICGLAFTARQESALLCLILAIFFVLEKKYVPIFFLGVVPLVLDILGFIHTGDILWVWSEMKTLGEFNLGIERSFFHYFEVYIYITGPIVLSLFMIGLFAPFISKEYYKTFFKREILIYLFFFTVFLFQCYLVIKGTNPGSWRYLLQISPLASIIALIGFNELLEVKTKKYVLTIFILFSFLTLLFLSKESTGLVATEKSEYVKLILLIIMLGGVVFLLLWSKQILFKQFLFLTLLLAIGFTFYSERPKQQSPENATVDLIASWYNKNIPKSDQVLYNHSLILFYGNIYGADKERFKILNMKALDEAPSGTIVIWDSHYSYRPEYKNDTKLEYLQNNNNYKLLNQFVSPDRRFGAFIFQKQL
jgi:hypothetical protein